MSGFPNDEDGDGLIVPLDKLPPAALQALYHSVTGRTENYSEVLRGNVIIDATDIDQLYEIIRQQIAVYTVQAGPSINVVMTHSNDKKVRYSSWERWKTLPVNIRTITSEIIIRWEFVFELPNTNVSQRCVINITLDSGLPILDAHDDKLPIPYFLSFFSFSHEYKTAIISIDFVDYLVAKTFSGFIDEWFQNLKKVEFPKWALFISKNSQLMYSAIEQLSRIGLASFLATFAIFHRNSPITIKQLIYAFSMGLILWAIIAIISRTMSDRFISKIMLCIPPSVILLTVGDREAFGVFNNKKTGYFRSIISISMFILSSIALNVLSSYLYSYLSAG